MSAQLKIKTRCPVCKAAYAVPNHTVGHRARCPKCDSVFRVLVPGVQPAKPESPSAPEVTAQRPDERTERHLSDMANRRPRDKNGRAPSDDDIVSWLMEGSERDDVPEQPRRWIAPTDSAPTQPPQAHKASA
jgi:predicted Zn finger-like uncharacterized protein